MAIFKRYLFIISILFSQELLAQDYSFTRYDLKDGLAGSTAYSMVQDTDGFIWIGTETGLSRFDGTHFKSFSTEDGLPDNEILNLFADSKGRVWIAPFKISLCYYLHGEIHTKDNDSILAKIHLKGNIYKMAEDANGNLLLQENYAVHLIEASGEVKSIDNINGVKGRFNNIGPGENGGFSVFFNDSLFDYKNQKFTGKAYLGSISAHMAFSVFSKNYYAYKSKLYEMNIVRLKDNAVLSLPFSLEVLKMVSLNDSLIAICKKSGSWIYNINTLKLFAVYLKENTHGYTMIDKEKNWWFCTLGQGVYKLNSDYIYNVTLLNKDNRKLGITSIAKGEDGFFMGTDFGSIYEFKFNNKSPEIRNIYFNRIFDDYSPIIALEYENGKGLYCGSGAMYRLIDITGKLKSYINKIAVKKISNDGDSFLVATNSYLLRISKNDFNKRDTIWTSRTTSVYKMHDSIYIGSLDGLYLVYSGNKLVDIGEKYRVLNNRISYITASPNGVVWIATYGGGIASLKNGKLLSIINQNHGLPSNICKTILATDDYLWVGTDKGVAKVELTKDNKFGIRNYSEADGLLSDNINVVHEFGGYVFFGTSKGISYFKNDEISLESTCDLNILSFYSNGTKYSPNVKAYFKSNQNNIQFEFVAISFRSRGDIVYEYRLIGSDTTWSKTRQNVLNYPALPSGIYEFEIVATNKFGKKSEIKRMRFEIEPLLQERVWFRALLLVVFLLLISLGTLMFINRNRRKEREKINITKKISELERLALKSQMNPHFIFNSLNSIQQYVMDKDVSGANKFIAGFSKLIRQTLDFSSKQRVSIEEEVEYLSNYLELEKTRLEDAFEYSIEVDPAIKGHGYFVPPLILQPFVENSIRHGVRNRKDRNGKISLKVSINQEQLYFVLEDNGVGRKQSQLLKSAMPIEYQSKGMSLTANRVELMNNSNKLKMQLTVEDAFPDDSAYPGTRIIISIPTDFN